MLVLAGLGLHNLTALGAPCKPRLGPTKRGGVQFGR